MSIRKPDVSRVHQYSPSAVPTDGRTEHEFSSCLETNARLWPMTRCTARTAAFWMTVFLALLVLARLMGNVSGESAKDLMDGMDAFRPGEAANKLLSHSGCRTYYEPPPADYNYTVVCTNLEGPYFKSASAVVSTQDGIIQQVSLFCRDSITVGDVMLAFPDVHRTKKQSKPQVANPLTYGSAISYVNQPTAYGLRSKVSTIVLKVQ